MPLKVNFVGFGVDLFITMFILCRVLKFNLFVGQEKDVRAIVMMRETTETTIR